MRLAVTAGFCKWYNALAHKNITMQQLSEKRMWETYGTMARYGKSSMVSQRTSPITDTTKTVPA